MSYVLTENFYKVLPMLTGITTSNVNSDIPSATGINTTGSSVTFYVKGMLFAGLTAYISSDNSALSISDYTLCDDAIAATTTILQNGKYFDYGALSQVMFNYTNTGDEALTIRKIQIVYKGNTSTYVMVEELLDTPVTLAVGDTFARIYTFKLTAE